jgi:hypothetical protein
MLSVAVAAIGHEIHEASGLNHRIETVPVDEKIVGAVDGPRSFVSVAGSAATG